MSVLAFEWADRLWVPIVMMFGLASAPNIFTNFMRTPLKAIRMRNPSMSYRMISKEKVNELLIRNEPDCPVWEHYICYPLIRVYVDDIIGVHRNKHLALTQFLNTGLVLKELNLTAKESKDQWPSSSPIILGALIHLVRRRVFLTQEKLDRYAADIEDLLLKDSFPVSRLFTVTGRVRHASEFLRLLATFARSLDVYVYSA